MPARPLAERSGGDRRREGHRGSVALPNAVAKIEAQPRADPRRYSAGWTVIAPADMQLGRYADAAKALRKVIAAEGPTADRETDLGEALMMEKGGDATGEPMDLFRSAAVRDPARVRSRYYMAGELTRTGEHSRGGQAAWASLLALSKGGEAWVANAEAGLAFAREQGASAASPIRRPARWAAACRTSRPSNDGLEGLSSSSTHRAAPSRNGRVWYAAACPRSKGSGAKGV